ncbi:MAG: hypothetical protein ACI8SA_001947, partial [Dokdonia sp.]
SMFSADSKGGAFGKARAGNVEFWFLYFIWLKS